MTTFVGNQGAIDFLSEWDGPQSKEVEEAISYQREGLLFSHWIDQACQRLSDFYAREIPRENKLRGREEIFRWIQEEFKELKVRSKMDTYKGFERVKLNNAVLLTHHRYIHRLEKFETLYGYLGKDPRKVVKLLGKMKASEKDASFALDRWVVERSASVPSSLR